MSILSSSYIADICYLVDEKKMGRTATRTKYWFALISTKVMSCAVLLQPGN